MSGTGATVGRVELVLRAQVADRTHRAIEIIGVAVRREADAYSHTEPRPLLGYVGIAGVYTAAVTVGRNRGTDARRVFASRDLAIDWMAIRLASEERRAEP
jgi:hypothetical protein